MEVSWRCHPKANNESSPSEDHEANIESSPPLHPKADVKRCHLLGRHSMSSPFFCNMSCLFRSPLAMLENSCDNVSCLLCESPQSSDCCIGELLRQCLSPCLLRHHVIHSEIFFSWRSSLWHHGAHCQIRDLLFQGSSPRRTSLCHCSASLFQDLLFLIATSCHLRDLLFIIAAHCRSPRSSPHRDFLFDWKSPEPFDCHGSLL